MTSRESELDDDGLITPEINAWGEEKYRLVGNYATMFAKAMKGKWGSRVYIDLFSGAGRAQIKGTNRIIPASPMLALEVKEQFDRYIFCEKDVKNIAALEQRVKREHSETDVYFIPGDTNKNVDSILEKIPQHRPGFSVLCFCFADPFKLENLQFETIRQLSARFVDFLILVPSGMDANRNVAEYRKPANKKVADFLGTDDWRAEWAAAEIRGESFEHFLSDSFGKQMVGLNYIYPGVDDMKTIRSTEKNLLLYRLGFFSRSDLGRKFWEQAKKYSQDQRSLF